MMSWTMDEKEDHGDTASAPWPRTCANSSKPPTISNTDRINTSTFVGDRGDELMMMNPLCSFKPTMNMIMEVVDDDEWYNLPTTATATATMPFAPISFIDPDNNSNNHHHLLLHHPVDSSSSCSPSPSIFTTNFGVGVGDPSSSQVQYFLPPPPPPNPKPTTYNNNPFEIGCELGGFLEPQGSTTSPVLHHRGPSNSCSSSSSSLLGSFIPHHNLASNNHFNTQLLPVPQGGSSSTGFAGFQSFEEGSGKSPPLFLNRPKILRPLDDSLPPSGAQPTLFQKRAALRKNIMGSEQQGGGLGKCEIVGEGSDNNNKKRRVLMLSSGDEMEDASLDGSALNYDSDDLVESNYNNNNKGVMVDEDNAKNGGNNSMNGNSTIITGRVDQKGKKKGMPAKNLMAERRRRKKLNDRLYMLRSVVPKISKMDRASILGDAIEYLKELLQRINDLHNELESSTSGGSSLTPVSSFHPLTPTPPALPGRIKEEMCPSSLPSPNGQPARVEVRLREGRAVNIHMFCGRKPGLLLSTMRALDNLGLDIQQAVISCFNGLAMDVFRAEQCKEGQEVHPEQIKAVLLDTAGYPGMI